MSTRNSKVLRLLVYFPAIGSNLTIIPSEGAKVPHLDNSTGKVCVESGQAGAVSGDQRIGGAASKELLVGVQEAFVLDQVFEICVVENERGGGV